MGNQDFGFSSAKHLAYRTISTLIVMLGGLCLMGMAMNTSGHSNVAASKGNGNVITYPEPPAGFDPYTASNAELAHYGLPPRPDPHKSPELYRQWQKMISVPRVANPKTQRTQIYNGAAQRSPVDRPDR
ncbi:MAG TPA: hypothetical protein VJ728_12525 [Candidatus Binataceae bacterium]|nr:hypothetical protein [Candidatus Binataceae bacterium]